MAGSKKTSLCTLIGIVLVASSAGWLSSSCFAQTSASSQSHHVIADAESNLTQPTLAPPLVHVSGQQSHATRQPAPVMIDGRPRQVVVFATSAYEHVDGSSESDTLAQSEPPTYRQVRDLPPPEKTPVSLRSLSPPPQPPASPDPAESPIEESTEFDPMVKESIADESPDFEASRPAGEDRITEVTETNNATPNYEVVSNAAPESAATRDVDSGSLSKAQPKLQLWVSGPATSVVSHSAPAPGDPAASQVHSPPPALVVAGEEKPTRKQVNDQASGCFDESLLTMNLRQPERSAAPQPPVTRPLAQVVQPQPTQQYIPVQQNAPQPTWHPGQTSDVQQQFVHARPAYHSAPQPPFQQPHFRHPPVQQHPVPQPPFHQPHFRQAPFTHRPAPQVPAPQVPAPQVPAQRRGYTNEVRLTEMIPPPSSLTHQPRRSAAQPPANDGMISILER